MKEPVPSPAVGADGDTGILGRVKEVASDDVSGSLPHLLVGERIPRNYDAMSPLRYPGGKHRMVPALRALITANIPRPDLFVEPFAGGASVSLGLLHAGVVRRVLLADLDPLVASFWKQAAYNPDELIQAMHKEEVTIERWDYWRARRPRKEIQKALKCLFLSRTTFSGIIGTGGPIGGRAQTSKYAIDCRFNKDGIERRIRTVARYAAQGRIAAVAEAPWEEALRLAQFYGADFEPSKTLLYLDPPYVQKSSRLYGLGFTEKDHARLANHLMDGTGHRWILSYDADKSVVERYSGYDDVKFYTTSHDYTITGRERSAPVRGREVVFTNLPTVPDHPEE